ncbi:MAG: ABC transporter permease [Candidatus Omnitrophota bacterium]
MRTFLKIAWRNITRNRKRSLITISAVGFGLGALIFIWSFVEGAHFQMIDNYTSLSIGHIQIHARGFHEHQKLETYIEDPAPLLERIRAIEGVRYSAPRIRAQGLISSSESSSGALILGVDPDKETRISSLHKSLGEGNFLSAEENDTIVIGKDLAAGLKVSLDDKIVIMSQALDGSIAASAYYISGLIDSGVEEIDRGLVLITHRAAENLFVMQDKTSEIALKLQRGDRAQEMADLIRSRLDTDTLEILPWQTVSPIMKQWIDFDNTFIWVIVFIVMIVVAIGILNTVLMGVLERTREFGILLALGTKRGQIVTMVAWESVFLGCIGSLMGAILGISLTALFHVQGIDLGIFTSALSSFYMDPVIYPRLNTMYTTVSTALVLITSICVSIYPAWLASRLKPIEAIRSL